MLLWVWTVLGTCIPSLKIKSEGNTATQGTVRAEIIIPFKSSSYSKIYLIQNVSNSALKFRATQRLFTEELKAELKSAAGKFYSPSLETIFIRNWCLYVFKSMFCQSVKSWLLEMSTPCCGTGEDVDRGCSTAPPTHLKPDRQHLLPVQPCLPTKLSQGSLCLTFPATPRGHKGLEIKDDQEKI